jgi:hypothetical protein
MNPKNFFAELNRRNVIRAAILYLGADWALAQGISQSCPSLAGCPSCAKSARPPTSFRKTEFKVPLLE